MLSQKIQRVTLAGLCLFASFCARADESDNLIWPRIAAGMQLVDTEQPESVAWARQYAERPEQLKQMLARAEPFLWYIVEAVEQRKMPLEIALLPAVESGFDPHARSGRSAQGLWQIVPSTGRALGLKENEHYDAKRDAVASTRAALTYLKRQHKRFGNWLLALAAYNAGGNKVGRAIRAAGGKRSFWDLDLPSETREHIPRLLGLALLVLQPERFGVDLPPIRNEHITEVIALKSARDLETAAARAGVPAATIERYNPGLKTLSNTRGKKYLMLPTEDAVKLGAELSRREYKPAPDTVKTAESKRFTHTVKTGESLWVIARRYKVSIAQLRDWNPKDAKNPLKPGRKLVIVRG